MSAVAPTPEAAPAPAAPAAPSKFSKAVHAAVAAAISPEGKKLEFAVVRYVAYAVLTAFGVKHASFLGF